MWSKKQSESKSNPEIKMIWVANWKRHNSSPPPPDQVFVNTSDSPYHTMQSLLVTLPYKAVFIQGIRIDPFQLLNQVIVNLSTIRMSGHKNWNHIFKFFSDKYLDSETKSRLHFVSNISVNDVFFLSHFLDLVTRSSYRKFVGEEHETRPPERVHGSLSIEYIYLLLSLQRQRFQICNPKRVN